MVHLPEGRPHFPPYDLGLSVSVTAINEQRSSRRGVLGARVNGSGVEQEALMAVRLHGYSKSKIGSKSSVKPGRWDSGRGAFVAGPCWCRVWMN